MNRIWAQISAGGSWRPARTSASRASRPAIPSCSPGWRRSLCGSGWSLKAMQRLIVTSATYRQSSRVTPDRLERDPYNRLFSRGPRFRMEAEMVRDQALALSGLLEANDRRPERLPLPARRHLVRPVQRRPLDREPGRRSVSPGPLYVLATLGSVSRVHRVRRPEPRGLLRAALANQHAPPGAGDAQRSGLRPARGRAGQPHPDRVRRGRPRIAPPIAFRLVLARKPRHRPSWTTWSSSIAENLDRYRRDPAAAKAMASTGLATIAGRSATSDDGRARRLDRRRQRAPEPR